MNEFKQLEFDKIKKYISDQAESNITKKYISTILPLKDKKNIEKKLATYSEFKEFIDEYSAVSCEKLSDLDEVFKHLIFNFEEFKQIYYSIKMSNEFRNKVEQIKDEENFKKIITISKSITLMIGLERRFTEIFNDEGEVLDNASHKLSSIRKRKKAARNRIFKILKGKFTNPLTEKFIQDKIITQRNNRYVIPVKENSVGFSDGIVHSKSGSKSSVYFEPKEIYGFNNEMNTLADDEKQEIYRIFTEYSAEIISQKNEILENVEVLKIVDYYQAICKYAKKVKANVPEIIDEPNLQLLNARHPLLIIQFNDRNKVIPFDLSIDEKFRILLISGPNTGGKTITLKAIGLLTTMALSGFPIPASSNSKIGIFTSFFADIGDEQSLENSLSTFSSHINRIKKLTTFGNERSLALIDEIGSATDPEQGSALAQAIVEDMVKKNMVGVITTHYTKLKVFAEQNDKCVNASVQFDPMTHNPTYKFNLGIPGNSFAIEIATKLGLNENLIKRAKELTGDLNVELTDLIKKIDEQRKELGKEIYSFQLKNKLLERKISEKDNIIKDLESSKKEILKKSKIKAQEYLLELQQKMNTEIEEIKKTDRIERKRLLKESLKNASTINQSISNDLKKINHKNFEKIEKPEIGQNVYVNDFDSTGRIIDFGKNWVKVEVNGFHYKTSLDKISPAKAQKEKKGYATNGISIADKSINLEIKLLGMTFEEAKPLVDEFIDNALLGGLNKVRIVHGKGTGVLRRKIRQYLRKNNRIVEFYSPPQEAGGDGVTVVSFG